MPDEDDRDVESDLILQLEPLGLVCGGGPLKETWVDLRSRNHVFYGLNGAGKSTILNALEGALIGIAPGGRILLELPIDEDHADLLTNGTSDRISEMFAGGENQIAHVAYSDFVGSQAPALATSFESRMIHHDGTPMDDLNWDSFIWALAHSKHWLFKPVGTDAARWEASPVLLVDALTNKWAEHVATVHALADDESTHSLPSDFGLDLLWWESAPPQGAPQGVVSTLLKVTTEAVTHTPWWPFGHVITDSLDDPSALTRRHLLAHPSDRWGTRDEGLTRDVVLTARAKDIETRANALLPNLLSDAPALQLTLGDDAAWFAGDSCTWTATRFQDDQAIPIHRLSSAERRWTNVAVYGAIGLSLESMYEMRTLDSSTWLVIDEPERGLHRTAESHMARGLQELARRGTRTVAATHSPELLDHGLNEVSYVRRRTHDQPGAVIAISQFVNVRTDLGLNPSDMLRRTRGIILVEGEHDLEVLQGALGGDLDRLGVTVLPTRGGSKLKTVVDSRFLYEFTDAVLFPLLDDLALEPTIRIWEHAKAAARIRPASDVISELMAKLRGLEGKGRDYLEEFLAASVKNGTFERVQPLGIPQTDVLLCLPVKELVPTAASWQQIRDELRRSSGKPEPSETEFKAFLKKRHRANLGAENIRRLATESAAHPDIKALLATISERLES